MKRLCVMTAKITDTVHLFMMPFVRALEARGYEVRLVCGEGKYRAALEARGLRIETIPYRVSANPFAVLGLVARTRDVLRAWKPELLIANDPSAALITRLAAKAAGVPTVVYFAHGLAYAAHSPLVEKTLAYMIERAAAPATDAIITINEDDFSHCRGRYRAVYKLNGVGVDTERFHPPADEDERARIRASFGFAPEDRLVGFAGRLVAKKGVRAFADAAEIYGAGDFAPRARFLIVGDGPLKEEIERRAAASGGRLGYLGYVEDMPALFRALDALVLPTEYPEGLPRVLLEAMASGVPVVSSDIRGVRDLIGKNEWGRLIPTGDSRAIAEAVGAVLGDEEARRKTGLAGRARVLALFDTPFVLAQFAGIMDELESRRA